MTETASGQYRTSLCSPLSILWFAEKEIKSITQFKWFYLFNLIWRAWLCTSSTPEIQRSRPTCRTTCSLYNIPLYTNSTPTPSQSLGTILLLLYIWNQKLMPALHWDYSFISLSFILFLPSFLSGSIYLLHPPKFTQLGQDFGEGVFCLVILLFLLLLLQSQIQEVYI